MLLTTGNNICFKCHTEPHNPSLCSCVMNVTILMEEADRVLLILNIKIMRIFFYIIVSLILCSICNEAKGQRTISLGLLKITDINGEVDFDGFYNKKLYTGQNYIDKEKISHIAPTVNINTKSYL